MWRSFSRTVRRLVTGEKLWSDNRENWRGLLFWRGEDSILWWAWTSYGRIQERYESAMLDPENQHLVFCQLRTSKDVDHLVVTLARRQGRRQQ
jgi:hypothetical protein